MQCSRCGVAFTATDTHTHSLLCPACCHISSRGPQLCTECGSPRLEGKRGLAKFCPDCGTAFPDPVYPEPSPAVSNGGIVVPEQVDGTQSASTDIKQVSRQIAELHVSFEEPVESTLTYNHTDQPLRNHQADVTTEVKAGMSSDEPPIKSAKMNSDDESPMATGPPGDELQYAETPQLNSTSALQISDLPEPKLSTNRNMSNGEVSRQPTKGARYVLDDRTIRVSGPPASRMSRKPGRGSQAIPMQGTGAYRFMDTSFVHLTEPDLHPAEFRDMLKFQNVHLDYDMDIMNMQQGVSFGHDHPDISHHRRRQHMHTQIGDHIETKELPLSLSQAMSQYEGRKPERRHSVSRMVLISDHKEYRHRMEEWYLYRHRQEKRRCASLPNLRREEEVEEQAMGLTEEEEDGYSSDEEYYSCVVKSDSTVKEGEGAEGSEKGGADPSTAATDGSTPMEDDPQPKDADGEPPKEEKQIPKAGEKTTVKGKEEPREAAGLLKDVVEIFEEYKKKLDDALNSNHLNPKERGDATKWREKAENLWGAFFTKPMGKKAPATAKPSWADIELPQHEVAAMKGMSRFINETSLRLNQVFTKASIPKVNIIKIVPEKIKKRAHRVLTFKVVLSTQFIKYFEQMKIPEPCVEIKADNNGFTKSLVQLRKSHKDLWVGELSTPLSTQKSTIKYRYLVYDGFQYTKDNWEYIHRAGSKAVCRSVIIGGNGPDAVIYDGVTFPSKFSQIWKTVTPEPRNYRSVDTEYPDYSRAICAMLPQWTVEMEKGSTVHSMMTWIEEVKSQQYSLLTGFEENPNQRKHDSAQRHIDQVLKDYVMETIQHCVDSLPNVTDVCQIVGSMLGLLYLARCRYDDKFPIITGKTDLFLTLISSTMARVGELNKDLITMTANPPSAGKKGSKETQLSGGQKIASLICKQISGDEAFLKRILDSLLSYIEIISNPMVKRQQWIALLPFVGLLASSGTLVKFSTQDQRLDPQIDPKIVKSLGYRLHNVSDWRDWLSWLSPWFKVDLRLPYSFLNLLTRDQLIHVLQTEDILALYTIPLNGVLACVNQHIRGRCMPNQAFKLLQGTLKFVRVVLKRNNPDEESVNQSLLFLRLTMAVHTSNVVSKGIYEAVQIYLLVAEKRMISYTPKSKTHTSFKSKTSANTSMASNPSGVSDQPTEKRSRTKDEEFNFVVSPLVQLLGDLCTVFEGQWNSVLLMQVFEYGRYDTGRYRSFSKRDTLRDEEMQIWDELFQCKVTHEVMVGFWHHSLSSQFKQRLLQVAKSDAMTVVDLYCNKDFVPEMGQVVADVAFLRAEQVLMDTKKSALLSGKMKGKIGKLVDQALNKTWDKKDESPRNIVRNMVKWGNFLPVWNFYKNLNQEQKASISSINRDRLAKSAAALQSVFDSLLNGSITISHFGFLRDYSAKVLELCDVSSALKQLRDRIENTIQFREEQRKMFLHFKSLLSDLWHACSSVVEGHEEVDSWLSRQVDSLRFCDTITDNGHVICAMVPQELRDILEPFRLYHSRRVYQRAFAEYVNESPRGPIINVADIHKRAIVEFNKICQMLDSGDLTIRTLERIHDVHFDENLQSFHQELEHMVSPQVLDERRRQVTLCAHLDLCHKNAETMLDMQKLFALTGDFSDMESILQSRDKRLLLRSISDDLLKKAGRIKDITNKQILCIKEFKDCTEFVEWVKAEVPRKDISNFVDLASSTLGEDDLAAQKTRYLLNALTGYAPLIYYDFANTETSFEMFLELCNEVWNSLRDNSELQQNLKRSAAELDWIRKVKSHFGSVEIDSIAQATAINETGVYLVGNIHGFSQIFKAVDDVIMLTCMLEERKRGESGGTVEKVKKQYTYTDLKELQSKLTLVAGDKQKENMSTIKRFDEMRDAVENLARGYLEIRKEGCIQFDELLIKIECNNKVGSSGVKFKLQSVKHQYVGKITADKTSLAHCHDLYAYMKSCLEHWRQTMDEKRCEHPELNFYTTEQLVVLRKELGTYLKDPIGDRLKQSLPLLGMIHPINPSEIAELLSQFSPSVEMDVDEDVTSCDSLTNEQRALVEEIMEDVDDCPQSVAVQAVLKNLDHADTMAWIEENKDMEVDQSNKLELQTSEDVLKELTAKIDKSSTFIQQLEALWDGFNKITGHTISNFLSVEHLGFVLCRLKGKRSSKDQTRKIPFWLERRRPQLIAAPQKSTYQMVLSIYAHDPVYSFPTRNEVLICNSDTNNEQVSLFLNRVLADEHSFYCMVNCHLLGYDVCRAIEHRVSSVMEESDTPYGLALIYAEEVKEARIKAYLDKYLIKNPVLTEKANIAAYVKRILSVPKERLRSACHTDPERSMARLIRSNRAGVGKSLQRYNLIKRLRVDQKVKGRDITIPIYKHIYTDKIIERLTEELGNGWLNVQYDTIHIDIAHEVESGVDELLFNLIILRSIVNSEGVVWQAQNTQYYIIECMPYTRKDKTSIHEVLDLLPTIQCITPEEAIAKYEQQGLTPGVHFIGFDPVVLAQLEWQTVLKYLEIKPIRNEKYKLREGDFSSPRDALILLRDNCGLKDPTWSELRHYVYFLSNQLFKVEKSPFCSLDSSADLPGFKHFVVQFMFRMAKDFATRSLKIAEETPGSSLNEAIEEEVESDAEEDADDDGADILDKLAMKRTWESGNHPYLFFNEDGATLTPLGFFIEPKSFKRAYSLLDSVTGEVLVPECITRELKMALQQADLSMSENFDNLSREVQLKKLRSVVSSNVSLSRAIKRDSDKKDDYVYMEEPLFQPYDDPDTDYVLTMDNAKKILAIHQRLRVDIPVIIMGETGCGKTKLIEFMSKLQVPTALKKKLTTMVTVKVHGGTTEDEIVKKVTKAQELAMTNQEICSEYAEKFNSANVPTVYTILFLDEANTTEAIGLVKEILCDGRMRGVPLDKKSGLKIIAACNPYKRHTPDMINKLKRAGLGYNVSQEDTKDKFGQIPMRHLVYRVQPLSQSLLPLVWDFGTLKSGEVESNGQPKDSSNVEVAYIRQMIVKFNSANKNKGLVFGYLTSRVAAILTVTQCFMREQKDECSFVSLRDIQRVLDVSAWFHEQRDYLFATMDALQEKRRAGIVIELPNRENMTEEEIAAAEREQTEREQFLKRNYPLRSLILALGVCYLARLEEATRKRYAEAISELILDMLGMRMAPDDPAKFFLSEIELCQDVFIDAVIDTSQHKNIAKNKALKENVFMMIVCIENRIPLFLVGKPGSSKSLSKSMVVDAMKGTASQHDIFKRMKRSYMVSFQCSRHATPAGIVGVFNHCAKFQKGQDLDTFVSVVVLDEVGLAEDSENMPLKTLHPLLEDGCEDSSITPEPHMKCAFIGISNWALDPAKMNRGIFVQRGTPQDRELQDIAGEICQPSAAGGGPRLGVVRGEFIAQLARGYLDICVAQKPEERDLTEFFGLRDFYSLMKMVVNFATKAGPLNKNQLEHSIKRNFGGFDPDHFDPMNIFSAHCAGSMERLPESEDGKPPVDSMGLIKSSLSGADTALNGVESRYLLILTENLSVLSIILDEFAQHDQQPEVVFGSKFRDDVSYTQICHNIYRIKTCMDMGRPVILLNLDDLYESLYDALNQYFSTWGDKKFVDLGLGTHRVKAFVNDNFRLVVIADKNKVHSQFPIPLINRLEKHYISATSLLTARQREVKKRLEKWAADFVNPLRRLQLNMCPFNCDGCGKPLNQPYKLPCLQHYVGPCCREDMFNEIIASECPVDQAEISPEFDWAIDKAALQNRQYFENSTTETVFIGYSSETTALTIRQATEELETARATAQAAAADGDEGMAVDDDGEEEMNVDEDEDEDEHWNKVYERAKCHLLQCATGESVLRLDKTTLEAEAKKIQDIYLNEQYHETLQQYLTNLMSSPQDTAVYIQVTSFAELMVQQDEERLSQTLALSGHPTDVLCLFLKNFVKEDQFTETIRQFYATPSPRTKLLIVQCETADENIELLDSVRYIIQRESSAAASDTTTYTVLLLSLPRGRRFTGYQGGKWKCVHIDDPRSPEIILPSLSSCLKLTPSQIVKKLIEQLEESKGEEPSDNSSNMLPFILQCLPVAISIVSSTQVYDRGAHLKHLLHNNPEFRRIFLTHVYKLLEEQEEYGVSHWVKADAAKASNMKQSETLRHALEDALERAIVPALAAVISFIDVRQNLLILSDNNSDLRGLWLQIFDQCHKLGLNFDTVTGKSNTVQPQSKLPRSYKVQDVGQGVQQFRMTFPFSWIVKETIEKLLEAAASSGNVLDVGTLLEQFRRTPVGMVIVNAMITKSGQLSPLGNRIMDTYTTDYIYMIHPCANTSEHKIVGYSLLGEIQKRGNVTPSMILVHRAYKDMRQVMSNLPAIISLFISVNKSLLTQLETLIGKKQDVASDLVALNFLIQSLKAVKVYEITEDPEKWVDLIDASKSVVKQVLSTTNSSPGAIRQSRDDWMLLELKKLYVEHVIIPSPVVDDKKKRKSHKLMFFLKNVVSAEFQSMKGFQQVVLSLQETVKEGIRNLYPKCPNRCPTCDCSLDSPVRLPCQHMLCNICVREQLLCSQDDCGTPIPPNYTYDPAEDDISEDALEEFKQLRHRLNKFFMSFVSEMVFTSTPDQQILQWLVDRVTFRSGTRDFSVFNSGEVVDPRPVLRSFLLKLLLRCEQSGVVHEYLNQIIRSWGREKVQSQIQTMVLLMDCHKDLHEVQHGPTELSQLLTDKFTDFISQRVDEPSVDMLTTLSELQSVLSQVVELLTSQSECLTGTLLLLENSLKDFLERANEVKNPQPSYLLVRQLLCTTGESYLKDLTNTRQNYLVADKIRSGLESFTVPDVLAVYGGEQYPLAKAKLDYVIEHSGDQIHMSKGINDFKGEVPTDECLMLQILFTRITRTFAQKVCVPQDVCVCLMEVLTYHMPLNRKRLMEMMMFEETLPKEMSVSQSKGINLCMLVLSLFSCMTSQKDMADINPLAEIITNPIVGHIHFIPTMADNQYEIHQEVIRKALQTTNENPVAYRCPNGHPYIIGNCGRPYTLATCHVCGAQIGGQAHTAAAGNQALANDDSAAQSRPGHILGRQTSRQEAAPERELSSLSCAVLRCLTHLSMFTGSLFGKSWIFKMIRPALVRHDDVHPFLEAHIQLDLQQISQCCAESIDDSILLIHDVINRMKRATHIGANVTLETIEGRREWEREFDIKYIQPVFENKKARLAFIHNAMKTSQSTDIRQVLTTETHSLPRGDILTTPGLWAYRRPLTLPAVQNILTSDGRSCPRLCDMVNNSQRLLALRHLPDLLSLLRVMNEQFHSKFSRAKAEALTIRDFCDQYATEANNLRQLTDSYLKSWNLMLQSTSKSVMVSIVYMDIDSPLSQLLYDKHPPRSANRAENKAPPPLQLINFLVETHNKLLAFDDERPSIKLSAINNSNMISLASTDEILDLILTHSEYELRETTAITYNWPAIEREVLHRYISNKPRIEFSRDQLPCYVYQEDFNLHNQMQAISDSQERLSEEMQESITNTLPQRVPVLTAYLRELKVIINFLSVTPYNQGEQSLGEYMTATFGKEPEYISNEIKVKHVKHVWLLVKYAQTDLLMRQHQEPFDDLSPEYRDDLNHAIAAELNDHFRFNSPRTKKFLLQLFEFIVLGLNKAAMAQEVENPERSIDEAIKNYIMKSVPDEIEAYQLLQDLPPLAQMLTVKHASRMWAYIWIRYTAKPV